MEHWVTPILALVATLAGTTVGGLLALYQSKAEDEREHARDVQDWFVEKYVEGCTGQLLFFSMYARVYMFSQMRTRLQRDGLKTQIEPLMEEQYHEIEPDMSMEEWKEMLWSEDEDRFVDIEASKTAQHMFSTVIEKDEARLPSTALYRLHELFPNSHLVEQVLNLAPVLDENYSASRFKEPQVLLNYLLHSMSLHQAMKDLHDAMRKTSISRRSEITELMQREPFQAALKSDSMARMNDIFPAKSPEQIGEEATELLGGASTDLEDAS